MSAFAMFAFAILATKELQRWLFEDQYYLVAIDGPGYFCADHIKCDHCMVRRTGGKEQYYHQVVAAVLVHPVTKQVSPLAVEPIMRSDGKAKDDSGRNATGRLLQRLPSLQILIPVLAFASISRADVRQKFEP